MERRYLSALPVQIEERADGKGKQLTGYASVFFREDDDGTSYDIDSSWGSFSEHVLPGAFDRALSEGDDCHCLLNHDASMILGRTLAGTCRLKVDKKGLRYECDLPDTTTGRDVAELVGRGDITGSSFAFKATDDAWTDGKRDGKPYTLREIKSVRLFDVSCVTRPAYGASTAGIRAEGEIEEARASYLAWQAGRDAAVMAWARGKARAVQVEMDERR